uniref:Aminoglycoside phosphotransferase domain-containing protein n=1 Tax=Candidatus Kentrum sp. DK TaxID=2126562 RepID=A0A450SM01_9GAMM|nr:MAG: hypothetical protein BECKDK2373C_GA0170839_104419 [Candidatus Kentron sp. DK]
MDDRLEAMRAWLLETLSGDTTFHITPASQDASFRRYFRVFGAAGSTLIVMDAPPDREDSGRFILIARLLREVGVNVPEILAANLQQGFLLLSDLGTVPYLAELNRGRHDRHRVDRLYDDAMEALSTIQSSVEHGQLPEYDSALLQEEMALFPDWFLVHHRKKSLAPTIERALQDSFDFLQRAAAEQPRVFVHRDYHSRNLMARDRDNPGILDFQDAVWGPITYDLVSLFKDVYIRWPREWVEEWVLRYRDLAIDRGILDNVDEATWLRWFDLMGAQRHIKIAGIFARLHHRDGKPGYLADIPLTLDYLAETCGRHPELSTLGALLGELRALSAY